MISLTQSRPRWLSVHTLAIGFSLSHFIHDWHLDLFGPLIPTSLSIVQSLVLITGALVYSSWAAALALAIQGSQRGLMTALVLCAVRGLGNGLSIVACLPLVQAHRPLAILAISEVWFSARGRWSDHGKRSKSIDLYEVKRSRGVITSVYSNDCKY